MRKIYILLIAIMLMTFTIGCAKNDSKAEKTQVTTNILGSEANDKWYMLINGIGEGLNRNYPGSVVHFGLGAALSNIMNVNDNKAEFALNHTTIVHDAYYGQGKFEEEKKNISTVAILYPSPAQLVFNKKLGITSFGEIIENKIPVNMTVGSINGSTHTTFLKLLQEYGITTDDMIDWGCKLYNKGFGDTGEMFADEVIDGFFIVAGEPTVFVTQLSVNNDMLFLEIDQSILDAMCENYGYSQYIIDDDTYTFMDEDTKSFNSNTMLLASLETPEDTVYKITKSIYENLDYIKTLHASFEKITVETLAGTPGVPLHPGAERYYKEIGLID